MKLSPNFFLAEFVESDTAVRLGIDNTASPHIIANLKTLAEGLEQVRKLLGYPIFISSGYRCLALNKAIGGASTSAHTLGYAADFHCRSFGNAKDIVKKIVSSGIKFDQIINEQTWVHISFEPRMRQSALIATFNSKGKVSYKEFTA